MQPLTFPVRQLPSGCLHLCGESADGKVHLLSNFEALGLSPLLLKSLENQQITKPTPIQAQGIPLIMQGRDLMGLAQTGTGKTAAFGLPLLNNLLSLGSKPAPRTARALILAPTRELAQQITENLTRFTRKTHLKVSLVVGGASVSGQCRRMEQGTDVLVATPGRLLDLLARRAVVLSETRFLVLDEADQMLDMGFIQPLREIAKLLPAKRQTLLFSATMPKQMAELASAYLTDPVRVEVSPAGKAADKITQSVHFVPQGHKAALLKELMAEHRDQLALVFSRTKHGAERLMKQLCEAGFVAASIHGNKSQSQRDRALKDFKVGKIKVLVATDVAARGIDIPAVRCVYNFDLPNVAENYVHRIGRTARAGADGTAIAFCSQEEMGELRGIEKVLKTSISVASGEAWAGEGGKSKPNPQQRRRGKPSGGKPAGAKPETYGKPRQQRNSKPRRRAA